MTAPMTRAEVDALEERHRYDVELGRWNDDEVRLIAAARYGLDMEAEVERLREGPTFTSVVHQCCVDAQDARAAFTNLRDAVLALRFASDDGTFYDHVPGCEGQDDCPACWASTIVAVVEGVKRS